MLATLCEAPDLRRSLPEIHLPVLVVAKARNDPPQNLGAEVAQRVRASPEARLSEKKRPASRLVAAIWASPSLRHDRHICHARSRLPGWFRSPFDSADEPCGLGKKGLSWLKSFACRI